MAPKTDSQALPNKEAALFRQLVKQYESKMYKKGIKTADQILRKCPDNGETLAMKGLLLNCLERKEEAYDYVKRGVKANLRSHVCWHVYGLLYRSDRNYDEAIKCYKNSLRMDKDNITVLRDLTQLQVQMRDIPGFLESRQKLLELKPNNRQSWVGLALAHHLAGNYEVASTVIDSYEATVEPDNSSTSEEYEHSEVLLYKAQIMEEGGNAADALAAIEKAEKLGRVKDRLGAMEARARLLLSLGRYEEAEGVYRRLLDINTENYLYHDGLVNALRAQNTAENAEAVLTQVFAALQEQYPHSVAAKRRPLDFLTGTEPAFEAAADSFVRKYLAKGIPSLFSEMKPLYADAAKAAALGKVLTRFEASLAASGEFPEPLAPLPPQHPLHNAGHDALVWTRLYLALHYDILEDVEKALSLIDSCIAESPKLIELHSARARILKHAGDTAAAAAAAEHARKMDLADRYLNCLAVKALFKAGQVESAEQVVTLFTRDGEQTNNLYDMQATWYEIASGRAYLALGDYGRALKRFLKIDTHFADFVEDQFDFHSYCLRKQTMRSCVDMLRMEDGIYRHPVYAKAVAGAVEAYLALHDCPALSEEEQEAAKLAEMSVEDAKKYMQRKRKEEAKKKKEEEAAAAAAAAGQSGKKGADLKKIDPDPHGATLAATKDPLGEATKLVRRLETAAPERLDTQLLAFEVYSRKGRLLLALGAVKKAANLGGKDHPKVHSALIRLSALVQRRSAENGDGAAAPGAAGEVLKTQLAALLDGAAGAAGYQSSWRQQHGSASLMHRLAVAQSEVALSPEKSAQAAAELAKGGPGSGSAHKECVAVHQWLSKEIKEESAAAEFSALCAKVFRYSRYFGGELVLKEEGEVNGGAEAVAAAAGVKELQLA